MLVRLLFCLLLATTTLAQVPSFHAPATPTGSITVKLCPMENVTTGSTRLVTFGVPFPRGSITAGGLSTVRVLHQGSEIPAYVAQLTPWRHLTNAAHDGQSVRVALVQVQHAFSVAYPQTESLTVEWGGAARTLNVLTLTNPLTGWHSVTSGSYDSVDGIQEPDVYALLPKAVLAQGVLSLRRSEPFADHIAETRDDPALMDATEHWPGYEEADRAFKNFFYTSINEDDPLVTGYESGQRVDYKTESEPWLYDRASAFYMLYVKTGFLKPLREAVRATQFYKSKLLGTAVSDPYRGIFSLKAPTIGDVTGGNTAMYSYAECLAYDHWLTGDPQMVEPVHWVTATHQALTEPSRWSPTLQTWTERHTAFRTLANVVAFELTGEASYRQNVLTQASDFIWHQNGADAAIPANKLDGGLYHYGTQHGDGVFTDLIASPWMMSLTLDAMLRVYGMSEDPAIADFIRRGGKFQAACTHYNNDHDYEYSGALRYPYYLAKFDGTPDAVDGYDTSTIEHSKEVLTTIAWGSYFQHLLSGVPFPTMEANARELYLAYDIGVNHWTRSAAPPLGFTAFRCIPPRKFVWENRPSASLSWVMNVIDTISPPPVVAITSPVQNQNFTAPANILIEATASTTSGTIALVEFFDGAEKIGEDSTAPYSLQWNHVIASLPSHVLTAKATTTLGVAGSSDPVGLNVVSPTHPQLTITSPANNANFTAPASVTINATATPEGSSTITRVVFTQSYQPLHEDTTPPYSHTITGLLHGTHGYEIWAWDNNGGYTVQTLEVHVQTPTPPTANLTTPTTGQQTTNGAVLHMSATASAPGSSISSVVFYADGTPVGEDTTAPFEDDWLISSRWAAGTHTLTARAFEANGGSADSSTTFEIVSLPAMSVSIDSPAPNASFPFPATIPVTASATAPGTSIARIDFYANNTFVSSDSAAPFTADVTPTSVRQWELRARAVDTLGRTMDAAITVHVTGPAIPNVTITSPSGGSILTAPATPEITADASVNFATITRVQFYDGETLLGEDTTAPYSITAPPLSLGDHRLYAIATSSTGTMNQYKPEQVAIITVGAANSPVAVITSPRFTGTQQAPSFTTVRFAASALHTGGTAIQRVEFRLDGALVVADTTAPYEYDWTVGTNYGNHFLVARAYDVNGFFADSTAVDFDLVIPPSIVILSPVEGAGVSPDTPVTLMANVAPGNNPIDTVRFYVNSTLLGTDTTAPYSIEWTPTTTGTHQLSAYVIDQRYADDKSPVVNVTSAYTPIQQWRVAHFGSHQNSASGSDSADPDHDGLVNLLEYALNGDPDIPSTAPMPRLTNGTFEYTPNSSATDITLMPEWSLNLTQWFTTAPPSGETKLFRRLRVTRP
jgi:hypothetical protein